MFSSHKEGMVSHPRGMQTYYNRQKNLQTQMRLTSKSSCFLFNSASVVEESQSRLYSWAISFNTLSLSSADGVLTESFSIIWITNNKRISKETPVYLSYEDLQKLYELKTLNWTVDTRIRKELSCSCNKFLAILCRKQILNLQ